MGKALYRQYRPKSLKEIVGQEHITKTLDQALKSGRISHAYLFTGPRGVGKTSIARILAHEINGLPYTDDSAHMDIIEIDAASNRRIDEIRELRERVYIAPTSAKYKVYIIDEVHMLTKEAFNALLKTLEEPPAHVVFILATTDAHKLPDTIISRTQRYSFKPVETSKVVSHLRGIAKAEKIDVSDSALELLAQHGEGSFRDSISLLDQASNQTHALEESDVQKLLGIPPAGSINKIIDALALGDSGSTSIVEALNGLYDQGYQASGIAKQLGEKLRSQLIAGSSPFETHELLELLRSLLSISSSHNPERYLEIVLLEVSFSSSNTAPKQKIMASTTTVRKDLSVVQKSPSVIKSQINTIPAEQTEIQDKKKSPTDTSPTKIEKSEKTKPTSKGELNIDSWAEILTALKLKHNTLYGVVRMAQPIFLDATTLQLSFAFAFHQKRLNEAKNQQLLMSIIEQVTGLNVKIKCVVDKAATPPSPLIVTKDADIDKATNLSTVSNIFGGGELLES